MIDIPLIICGLCGLFYGSVWILNKNLIWITPRYKYISYEDWHAANNPKGLWLAPLILASLWPKDGIKTSISPMSDFLLERMLVTFAAIVASLLLNLYLYSNRAAQQCLLKQ